MWGISSQIKDPRVRKAAWEYIKFMTGAKADEIRTRSYVESGMWKYVNPDKLIKYGYKEYTGEIPKAWMEANIDAFKHGRPEPNGPNCEMIYRQMDTPMQAIYQNPNADPQETDGHLLRARQSQDDRDRFRPLSCAGRRPVAWFVRACACLLLVAVVVTKQVRAGRAEPGGRDGGFQSRGKTWNQDAYHRRGCSCSRPCCR